MALVDCGAVEEGVAVADVGGILMLLIAISFSDDPLFAIDILPSRLSWRWFDLGHGFCWVVLFSCSDRATNSSANDDSDDNNAN